MMNSKNDIMADQAIVEIIELIREEILAHDVDELIDRSAAAFNCTITLPITHQVFNQSIADLTRHIYREGLRVCRFITTEQALSEAIFLLDNTYENDEAKGYDGALLDAAANRIEGLETVLTRLVESIKTAEREKYIKCVFAGHVHCKDWKKRKDMVCAYLKRYKRYLPDNLVNLDPIRLVDCLPDLIRNHISGENIISKALWSL